MIVRAERSKKKKKYKKKHRDFKIKFEMKKKTYRISS